MSRESQHQSRRSPRNPPQTARNYREYTQVIDRLNAQLKHLSENIINKQPYLLSVPSDVPYRHSSRFVNTWYVGTPFSREEEQLQYMSFLAHQDDEEELLHVDGGWSDEKGNLLQEEEWPWVAQTSGRNTPVDAQRKKITLNDYKSKSKTLPEPTIKAAQPRDMAVQMEKVNGEQDSNKDHSQSSGGPDKAAVSPGPKRQLDEVACDLPKMDGSNSPVPISSDRAADQSRLGENQKTYSPQVQDVPPSDPKVVEGDNRKLSELPGLLSPTLPGSDLGDPLPQLVSPTLPPSIIKYLSTQGAVSDSSLEHHRTDSVRTTLASAGLGLSPNAGVKKVATYVSLTRNHVRSNSQHSARSTHSTTSAVIRGSSPTLKDSAKFPIKSNTPVLNSAKASPRPRQRHIIALKYGKKNRKRVEGLLKFAARPKKAVPSVAPAGKTIPILEESKPKILEESGPNKKRSLAESPILPSKRPKPLPAGLALPDKPTTPIPAAFHSPSIQPNSSQTKSAFSTPKKELKSSAMQRVASSDATGARTPTNDRVRLSTPLSTERSSTASKVSPQPTSAPTNRDEERAVWHSLNSQYFALGRTIKREATAMSQSGEPGNKETAMSVVLLIEGLLCFMINLTAISYSHHNSDPGWSTILPYHIYVFRASRAFPHLHGIVVQLGGVCRQYLHKYNMDRLARDPLPDEQVGSAPTPGSDGTTKTSDDSDKYKKKYVEFRDELVSNSRELQTAWLMGSRELSLDVLEYEYPSTWKKRARDSSLRGVGRPSPTKIPEDFFLPLDANATTFEAVRFTLAFLQEWTQKEELSWESRIEL